MVWSGEAFRFASKSRSPTSGKGARINGGRWNPPGIDTIYLGHPRAACLAEYHRALERQRLARTTGMLLHTLTVSELRTLDLTNPSNLGDLGLSEAELSTDTPERCRLVGEAASFLGIQAIHAPSATGVGYVLAVYESHLRPGQITPEHDEPLVP